LKESETLKFIADGMLGKITRWLRMLGHDVKYSNEIDDSKLSEIAKREGRVLLTKDKELYQQAIASEVDAFYLSGETEVNKLAELAMKFKIKLDINMKTSRCPKCNVNVEKISKEKVTDRVGKGTLIHYNEFWECPKCRKIYWQGAHWKRIRRTLEMARKQLE